MASDLKPFTCRLTAHDFERLKRIGERIGSTERQATIRECIIFADQYIGPRKKSAKKVSEPA